ncbi:MAG: hypothetical protein NXH95_14420 [Pseudomonadaceae bacterium]|nr:hypothetical protein [Pseudomonadaceae bacterium]
MKDANKTGRLQYQNVYLDDVIIVCERGIPKSMNWPIDDDKINGDYQADGHTYAVSVLFGFLMGIDDTDSFVLHLWKMTGLTDDCEISAPLIRHKLHDLAIVFKQEVFDSGMPSDGHAVIPRDFLEQWIITTLDIEPLNQ